MADADGTFDFSEVPPGDYVLRVYAGSVRLTKEVQIKPGTNTVNAAGSGGEGENGR